MGRSVYAAVVVVGLLLSAAAAGLWVHDLVSGPSGLVAYWPADGNAQDEVSHVSGTLVDGVGFGPGVSDQAFHFDGGDYVAVPNRSELNPEKVTVAAWFNAAPGQGYQFLVNKGAHAVGTPKDDSYVLGVDPDGSARWEVDTITAQGVAHNIEVSRMGDVLDNQFHQLVGTYDGATMRIYVDGQQVGSHRAAGPINASNTELLLGAGLVGGTPAGFQKGLLDDVRVYNRALYDGEIRSLYNGLSANARTAAP